MCQTYVCLSFEIAVYLTAMFYFQNFNECKLRKQSLYVKFDPLVSASPTAQIKNQLIKDAAALKFVYFMRGSWKNFWQVVPRFAEKFVRLMRRPEEISKTTR